MGGVSTSLLFSAFESWVTAVHRKRGFPAAWLEETFAIATMGNGLMAVLAGIIAQVLHRLCSSARQRQHATLLLLARDTCAGLAWTP